MATTLAQALDSTNVTGVKAVLIAQVLDCGPTRPHSSGPLTDGQAGRLHLFLCAGNVAQIPLPIGA